MLKPTKKIRILSYGARIIGGFGAFLTLIPFFSSWTPSEQVKRTAAPVRVGLGPLKIGQLVTVEWRGKPIWIIRRSQDMLNKLQNHDDELRDPYSNVKQQPIYAQNEFRSIKSDYLVLIGLCTHLGCSPKLTTSLSNHKGSVGFYCPCHGSRFDLAGRVYKGSPASKNLEVPPYRFIQDNLIEIGET